jgi:hypothetical protein
VIPVRDAPNLSFAGPRALPDGGFLVPWFAFSTTQPIGSLYLQELKTSQRLLPPVLIASDLNDVFILFELNSTGHGVVAWPTFDAQGYRSGALFVLLTVISRTSETTEP